MAGKQAGVGTLLTETEQERDLALVRRHQSGDAAAFGELYALHQPRLLRFCLRKVRDPHLAEELTQEAFLRAYRALDRFEGGRAFYPWLTVIAGRLIVDHRRRHERVRPEPDLELGVVDDAQEALVREVDREQVRVALQRVRGRHREVLRLRDWDEMSYEAIGERLGMPTTTVQSLLHRARLALRREYLAVVELERVGVLAPVGVLVGALRRWRRAAALRRPAWLPDPAGLATPLAAAACAVAVGLAPGHAPAPAPAIPSVDATGEAVRALGTNQDPGPAEPRAWIPGHHDDRDAPPERTRLMFGPEGAAAAQEEATELPLYTEAGPVFMGLDPETIVGDLAGPAKKLLGGQ